MAYCEQCGAKLKSEALFCEKCGEPTLRCKKCGAGLTPGMNFCENCGTKVPEPESKHGSGPVPPARQQTPGETAGDRLSRQEISSPDGEEKWSFGSLFSFFSSSKTFTLFQERNWESLWETAAKKAQNHELCIIMTHEPKLIEQLGCTQEELRTVLKDYVDALKGHGVSYYYLDLAKNAVLGEVDSTDVEMIVGLLKKISLTARPKYLFLLGDNTIVNVAIWENKAKGDGDQYVKSDLPFCTLDTDSPWENKKFDYDKMIRTGRLPTLKDSFQSFKAYFANAAKGIGHAGTPYASGVGAGVWEGESVYEFKHISDNKLELSPEMTLENYLERIDREKTNIYFFNLHGGCGKNEKYWYGQQSPWFPCVECVQPTFFEGIKEPYFIGVEACYGGRYVNLNGVDEFQDDVSEPYSYSEDESILRTAMANNCLSMLASSEIAYGLPEPKGSCADLIVGEFLAMIRDGMTAGDAYVAGVKRLMKSRLMDDTVLKTLAEFSLYGDPSACMGANPNMTSVKSMSFDVPKGIDVPIPDVLGPIRLLETKVDQKLEQAIDRFIMDKYPPECSSTKKNVPVSVKTFRIDRIKLTERVYTFNSFETKRIVKVYFDEKGNIRQTYVSK